MTPKPNTTSSPFVDEGPYRNDPARVANEAFQVATSVKESLSTVKTDLKILESRVLRVENYSKKEHGFLRTNWNGFWSFIRSIFDRVTSLEFVFCICVAGVIALIVWAIWANNAETDRIAREACQRANMTVIYSSSHRTSCLRADGAVLTISGENTPVLTVPNQ